MMALVVGKVSTTATNLCLVIKQSYLSLLFTNTVHFPCNPIQDAVMSHGIYQRVINIKELHSTADVYGEVISYNAKHD